MSASLITRLKNHTKETMRQFIPAHIRFTRAGKSFLAGGEREVHLLPQLVRPDTAAIDVGAHIGDYTYSLCKAVGPGGRVISIEPIADLAQMLQRAVTKLKLPVTVINCALSSRTGEADLLVPSADGKREAGFATLEPRDRAGKTFRVPLRRIDDICEEQFGESKLPVSFVKIDVEGHELDVLRGGERMLQQHRPTLLIEIEQRHSRIPITDTFDFVLAQGYTGEFLDADGKLTPLATFTVETHQTQRLDRVGRGGYVSNFIFKPLPKA